MDKHKWTLVTRDPRGRFFRPVRNAPVVTWLLATDSVAHVDAPEGVDVWYVPEGTTDRMPLLKGNGTVPVRWDAEPHWNYIGPPRG